MNGEGGIRTHGRLPFKRFRVVRFRPLSHLSNTGFTRHLRLTVRAASAFALLWRHYGNAPSSSAPHPRPTSTSCAIEMGVRSAHTSWWGGSGGVAWHRAQTRATLAPQEPLLRPQLQLSARLLNVGVAVAQPRALELPMGQHSARGADLLPAGCCGCTWLRGQQHQPIELRQAQPVLEPLCRRARRSACGTADQGPAAPVAHQHQA